jgi:glutamate racemase
LRIGVFDSGLGGLSVLRAIRAELPAASLAYAADSAWVPYGSRSEAFIRERSLTLCRFLMEHGAELLVVACNTATAAAVGVLRESLPVPVVGMEPAVKPATAATRNGKVGVLATVGTLSSARFAALLDRFGEGVEVLTRACPGLVECVEAGDLDGPVTRQLVARYVRPLVDAGADTLVLGCTHYPFLRPLIEAEAGPGVTLIDTGAAVARQVRRVADEINFLLTRNVRESFWTSGDASRQSPIVAKLWGKPVSMADLPHEVAMRH